MSDPKDLEMSCVGLSLWEFLKMSHLPHVGEAVQWFEERDKNYMELRAKSQATLGIPSV